MNKWKLVPTELTAENGMEAALIGEFHVPFPELDENGKEHIRKVNVPWTVIKKIHKAMIAAVPPLAPEDDYVGMLEETNATLKNEVELLKEALRPFAAYADHYPMKRTYGNRPATGEWHCVESGGLERAQIDVEDFHRAAEAIKEQS